jgi:hypothetical protein
MCRANSAHSGSVKMAANDPSMDPMETRALRYTTPLALVVQLWPQLQGSDARVVRVAPLRRCEHR